MTGKTLGRYRIEEKLGQGGMRVVYCSQQLRLALEARQAVRVAGERKSSRGRGGHIGPPLRDDLRRKN